MVSMTDTAPARINMALGQLITNQVLDTRLLNALANTPRELFVPMHLCESAYVDEDLDILEGRFLLAPLTFARLLQAADISERDNVLLIGCGSGYSVAVASHVSRQVTGTDMSQDLVDFARRALAHLNTGNAEVRHTLSHALGYANGAPFDAIIIEGAVSHVPQSLFTQLSEGGRLVTVQHLGSGVGIDGLGRIVSWHKLAGQMFQKEHMDVSAPCLPGFDLRREFVF